MKVSVTHSMCVKQAPIIIGSAACFISDLVHWWGSFVASASRASELQCMVCILFLQSKLENQISKKLESNETAKTFSAGCLCK